MKERIDVQGDGKRGQDADPLEAHEGAICTSSAVSNLAKEMLGLLQIDDYILNMQITTDLRCLLVCGDVLPENCFFHHCDDLVKELITLLVCCPKKS